jgi:hypothetical protein
MSARRWRTILAAIAAVGAIGLGGARQATAQTNAIATGNWSDPATWSAGEPNGTTPALINGGFTVTVDQAGETTNLIDMGTVAGETGNLAIAPGANLTVDGAGIPSIRVGQVTDSTGHVTMTGGTVAINGAVGSGFAIGDMLVGDNGTGTFTMSGGTLTAADEVFVGLGGTSNGTLSVSGGTLSVAGRNLLVAFFGGATGALEISGAGAVNVDEFLFSSFNDAATSTITQTGGTLNVGGALVHGRRGNATYNHSGGTVNVTTAQGNGDFVVGDGGPGNVYNISESAITNAGRHFLVGVFGDAVGTVNQTGGTINVGGLLRVGVDGIGNFTQHGGVVNVTGSVFLGDFDTSLGTYVVAAGELNVTGNLSVGAALASNAPANPTGTEGQALDADGTLVISGSAGSVNVDGNLLANPGDHTRRRPDNTGDNVSMLVFEILDASGVSTIDVTGLADLTGTIIDVDVLGGSFAVGSTFDLITAADISSDYLQAQDDAGQFALSIVTGGNGEILRATVIPEPVSAALAAVGALAVAASCARARKFGCPV